MWGYICGFLIRKRRFDRKGGFNSDAAVIDEITFFLQDSERCVFIFSKRKEIGKDQRLRKSFMLTKHRKRIVKR